MLRGQADEWWPRWGTRASLWLLPAGHQRCDGNCEGDVPVVPSEKGLAPAPGEGREFPSGGPRSNGSLRAETPAVTVFPPREETPAVTVSPPQRRDPCSHHIPPWSRDPCSHRIPPAPEQRSPQSPCPPQQRPLPSPCPPHLWPAFRWLFWRTGAVGNFYRFLTSDGGGHPLGSGFPWRGTAGTRGGGREMADGGHLESEVVSAPTGALILNMQMIFSSTFPSSC